MSDSVSDSLPSVSSTDKRKLWLWPPALLLLVQWGVPAALTAIAPDSMATFFVGRLIVPLICALLLVVWWMLSRAVPFRDRLTVLVVYLLTGSIVGLLGRKSFPPIFLVMYAVPVVTTSWAVWLLVTQWMRWSTRLVGTMLAVGLSFLYFSLIRMDGVDGSFAPHFSWRWTPTAEDKLLSASADSTEGSAASATSDEGTTVALTPRADDWLEFRGTARDNRVMGVSIETDWSQSPPKELWRKPVGPGWSSFTVVDGRVYTQYQKGEEELVVCWDAESGASIWTFSDKSRFEESVAGAGPRATPTYHAGRLYVTGAAGRVHCLDAVTGKSYWSRDLIADGGRAMPEWGFASSPLVVDGLVIVFAGGPEGKSLIAYQSESGEPVWSAGEGSNSYSSAHLVTLAGQRQVLLATDAGLTSFQPESGEVLWTHQWPSGGAARIVQPALVSETDLLIGTGMGVGTRRIRVTRQEENAWQTEEIWTTKRFKPYYNDFVVHEGHLYGFDGPIFMCVDVAEGQLRWRERGYGNGQVLLLADQGLLLILSEQGDIALLQANAERRQELSRVKAIEGKTWNHPVVAEGLLFVRNGEEAACYRLPISPATDEVAHRHP